MKRKLLILFLLMPICARAHNVGLAKADLVIASDNAFQLTLDFDLVAWLVGVEPSQLNTAQLDAFKSLSVTNLQWLLDTSPARFKDECRIEPAGDYVVTFPDASAVIDAVHTTGGVSAMPSNMPITVRGALPAGTNGLVFAFPKKIGAISFSIRAPGRPPFEQLLLPNEKSPAFALDQTSPPKRVVAWRYLRLGFEHILPKGLDHILFVLGLFLLSPKFKPLLWQVTAFTLAHSISLALSMYGVFSLPSRIVEPLIAASIVFVALENIFTKELHPWRPAVVFGFGLIHGLGFASVLTELDLPRHDFATALIAFNVGVELGQLSVIALATLAVGWFFRAGWYRQRIVIPASCAIALVGIYWAIERTLGV